MLRLATTILLTAHLLICPYRCLGDAAGGGDAPCQASSCCVHDQPDATGDESPKSPGENESDCLCHGAIMDNPRVADDKLISSPAVSWLPDLAGCPTNLSLAADAFGAPCQGPSFSTGRDVCLRTCTLQL